MPEFPTFLILPLFIMATLLAVIAYRKQHELKDFIDSLEVFHRSTFTLATEILPQVIRTETRRHSGWCWYLLEGRNVNLRVMEKEDLPLFAEWVSKPEFFGEYNPLRQTSRMEIEKDFDKSTLAQGEFIVEKKDGSKIGFICHFILVHPAGKLLEIGYSLVPSERGKGYCTEAVRIMVDYLFLSRDTMRIQACTDTRNLASQKVLEKAGFKREGTMRKYLFIRGELRDACLYSILREEWKEPKILTRTEKK